MLNEDEKVLVLMCFPGEAMRSYYNRHSNDPDVSLSEAKDVVREYIKSLNLPTPTHPYLKAAPIVGLKIW